MTNNEFDVLLKNYEENGEYRTKDGIVFMPKLLSIARNNNDSNQFILSYPKFPGYENIDKQDFVFLFRRYAKNDDDSDIFNKMGLNKQKYDFLFAIEPQKKKVKTNTITLTNGIEELGKIIKENIKNNAFRGIYRYQIKHSNGEVFYLIAICMVEDGVSTHKYFDCYLASSDSRSLSDKSYTFNISNRIDYYNVESMNSEWERNLLVFGAPGTGKSHYIKDRVDKKVEEGKMSPEQFKRVTFYADYTYEKFVGAYMPVPKEQTKSVNISYQSTSDLYQGKINAEGISYEFVPGPFLELLAKAITNDIKYQLDTAKNNNNEYIEDNGGKKTTPSRIPYVLVIEEINRANAASVFGDMFQIIERDDCGYSSYGISISEEIRKYLEKEIGDQIGDEEKENADDFIQNYLKELKLPCNFYLWATMNSADQGVFPMDTAFKRRWAYIYQSADNNRTDNYQYLYIKYKGKKCFVEWDALRRAINKKIEAAHMEEDRYIGPWYLKPSEFDKIAGFTKEHDGSSTTPLFDKIMSYLRQDVFKNYPKGIFKEDYLSFGAIRRAIYSDIPIDEILDIELEEDSSIDKNAIEITVGDKQLTIGEICDKNGIVPNDDIWMDINQTLMVYKDQDPGEEIKQKVLANMEENLKKCLGENNYEELKESIAKQPDGNGAGQPDESGDE